MAAKGQALNRGSREAPAPTEREAMSILSEVMFLAVPAPLYKELSDAAARKQQTLSQFLASAIAVYMKE